MLERNHFTVRREDGNSWEQGIVLIQEKQNQHSSATRMGVRQAVWFCNCLRPYVAEGLLYNPICRLAKGYMMAAINKNECGRFLETDEFRGSVLVNRVCVIEGFQ